MSKLSWTIQETVGVGIVNTRSLRPRLKGAKALYVDVLKRQTNPEKAYEAYLVCEGVNERCSDIWASLAGVHISSET